MKISTVVAFVTALAFFALLSSPAVADDPVLATMTQAHDLLHKAWGGDADATPTADQRTVMLKQAKTILQNAPPSRYHRHRLNAIHFIDDALLQLSKGDPDAKATSLIKSADDEVRDVDL